MEPDKKTRNKEKGGRKKYENATYKSIKATGNYLRKISDPLW